MWEKLSRYFTGRGFHEVNLNRDGMRLFYIAPDRSADPVWMIDDSAVESLSREQYERYLTTIRGIFTKQGYETVNVLTLFLTSRINACREIGEGTAYWIVDREYGRLIVYENQPEDFLGIRSVIENNLHFGGHSRNAEGAQTDLNNSNLRSESRGTLLPRDAVGRVSTGQKSTYMAERERQRRVVAERRSHKYAGVSVVTFTLIAINLIIFLLTDLFSVASIVEWGQMSWATVFEHGGYYRLFTCMFLHYGISHVGGNMIALYAFGDVLERQMSRVRYLILYIGAGLGASVVSCFYYHYFTDYDPNSAGASGAIYGLMGALLMMLILRPEMRRREYGMRFVVFIVYLIYSMVTAEGNVNVAAHGGGLVFGVILFLILDWVGGRRRRKWQRKVNE